MELVRTDNGYNANLPEERRFVFDTLAAGINSLKNATATSTAYLRRTIVDPLNILIARFGPAALGAAAEGAKAAVKDWVKGIATELLKWIF